MVVYNDGTGLNGAKFTSDLLIQLEVHLKLVLKLFKLKILINVYTSVYLLNGVFLFTLSNAKFSNISRSSMADSLDMEY